MTDQQKILSRMRDMTREMLRGGPQAATAAIQAALQKVRAMQPPGAAGPVSQSDGSSQVLHDINPPPAGKAASAPDSGKPAFDASSGAIPAGVAQVLGHVKNFVPELLAKLGVAADGSGLGRMPVETPAAPLPQGAKFDNGSFANAAGSRQYKLYVPAAYHGQALPLVVMLHGCTQDPDDFAAGTQMNAVAEAQQCLVLYPQQSQAANSSKCWNWFNAADQTRDSGEPSIIAGMTREVAARYNVDAKQIFVAGLSAGGAMAAIMGTTYPDLYAGAAVHSGLPYGAATDLPSALAAMRSGMAKPPAQAQQAGGGQNFKGIPVIVFHGDADHTVNMRNGEQVMAAAAPRGSTGSERIREQGKVPDGHTYTRTVHKDAAGHAIAEHWLIHGFGHAWAGGSANGSYTDARGPDASGEMMRFFYTQSGR